MDPMERKGGEAALIPLAPAIANAIYDAVGLRCYELPITPEKLLAGLNRISEEKERKGR